jgi:hypothetical protein
LKKLNKENTFFEDNENCPTCEQDIDEEFKHNKLKSMLKSDEITSEQKKQLSESMDNDNNIRLSLKKL